MPSKKQKRIAPLFFSMVSVVRGYNILVVAIAQYLVSIYILAPYQPRHVILDGQLFVLVMVSSATIAAGYIINNIYDFEKDLINRPTKFMLDGLVPQTAKLWGYATLNVLAIAMASCISLRMVIFFSIYIFGIWIYSYKLKKKPFIGNLVSAILTITPFFAVFIYYKNFEHVIFVHATYLFFLLAMKELTKDLKNIKGDLIQNYQTLSVVYGERISKTLLTALAVLTLIPTALLLYCFDIGYMCYFFYLSAILLVFFVVLLWVSKTRHHYQVLHNTLKAIIVLGVFSIVLIHTGTTIV